MINIMIKYKEIISWNHDKGCMIIWMISHDLAHNIIAPESYIFSYPGDMIRAPATTHLRVYLWVYTCGLKEGHGGYIVLVLP